MYFFTDTRRLSAKLLPLHWPSSIGLIKNVNGYPCCSTNRLYGWRMARMVFACYSNIYNHNIIPISNHLVITHMGLKTLCFLYILPVQVIVQWVWQFFLLCRFFVHPAELGVNTKKKRGRLVSQPLKILEPSKKSCAFLPCPHFRDVIVCTSFTTDFYNSLIYFI